jgi:hypothetical protein
MQGNEAAELDGKGGGIHAEGGARVGLSGNAWVYHGSAFDGAGLYLDGSTADLAFSSVQGNAAERDGGGVYLTNGSLLTGSNLSLIGRYLAPNTARYGGGVFISDSTMSHAGTVSNNEASESGGGIAALDGSNLTLDGAHLHSNTADLYGGGVYADDSTANVYYTRLHGNTAGRGGAYFQNGSTAIGDLQNTLICGNTTTFGYGAGIRSTGGVITLTHTTLAHNAGGAAYSQAGGEGQAINSVAWGNNSLGFLPAAGTFSGVCSLDQSGNAGPALDPLFVSPGAGENYRLGHGSPAIDRCASGLSDDLDHMSRPIGSGYDAGAYESPLSVYLPMVQRN